LLNYAVYQYEITGKEKNVLEKKRGERERSLNGRNA